MKLEFAYKYEDFAIPIPARPSLFRRNKAPRAFYVVLIAFCIALAIIAASSIYLAIYVSAYWLLVLAFPTFLATLLTRLIFKPKRGLTIREWQNHPLNGVTIIVELTEEVVTFQTPVQCRHWRFASIGGCSETAAGLWLSNTDPPILVPKQAFENDRDFASFRDAVIARCKAPQLTESANQE